MVSGKEACWSVRGCVPTLERGTDQCRPIGIGSFEGAEYGGVVIVGFGGQLEFEGEELPIPLKNEVYLGTTSGPLEQQSRMRR